MKILSLEAFPVDLKLQVALNVAYGSYPELNYVLIKIQTDNGLLGIGEASPDPVVTGETQMSVLESLGEAANFLPGLSAFDIGSIIELCMERIPTFPSAIAAIDMALYDLVGKALQVPAYQLLGGRNRSGMRLYPVIPMDEPAIMAGMSKQFVEMGARALKVKLGSDPEVDIERLYRITEMVGRNVRLRPDINQGWREPGVAIQTIRRMQELNIEYIEQPVAANDLDGLAKVTAAVDIPIMADESCHDPSDLFKIASMQAADMINIKLMKCGGIYQAQKMLAIAEAARLPCILGSMGESTIGSAAGLHFVTANAGIRACELLGPLFILNDPAEGFLIDPTTFEASASLKPGLGVQLK